MIQKLPTDKTICSICKDIAKAIPIIESRIQGIQKQRAEAYINDPIRSKEFRDGLQCYITDWYSPHLTGLRTAYRAILGVEYGSMQSSEVPQADLKECLDSTLCRRGIKTVVCENIEPRDGEKYVRIRWRERVK